MKKIKGILGWKALAPMPWHWLALPQRCIQEEGSVMQCHGLQTRGARR